MLAVAAQDDVRRHEEIKHLPMMLVFAYADRIIRAATTTEPADTEDSGAPE